MPIDRQVKQTLTALPVAALALTAILAGPPAPAEDGRETTESSRDWTQWRGPSRDGRVAGSDWPATLDGLKLRWRVPLGKGYPGPIVAGDRVFVVETVEKEDVAVRALASDDGRELWRQTWPSSGKVPFFAARNGDWVRSTPAWDGGTLFVGDMNEVLVALDGRNGEVRWTVDLPARFDAPKPEFGFASSPLIDGEHLYLQAANSLVKLERATGETVWRALAGGGGMTSSGAFSSPVFATLGGLRQLVVQTRQTLYGVGLDDGAVLWSVEVPNFRGMNILTPAVHGNSIFTSSYKNGTYLYRVTRDGDGFAVAQVWANKATGYMSSPVIVDGHAYLHLGNRRIDCIDLATGESRWRSEPFGEYWSMTVQGNRILALDADGTLHLVRASSEAFESLGSHAVAEQETWGHLAVQGDRLFVRELTAISAWDWDEVRRTATN